MNTKKIIFHEYKIEIIEKSTGYIYYYSDILYIKYYKPLCKIHFVDNRNFYIQYPFNKLLEILPSIFFQCKKSIIINLAKMKIYKFTEMEIIMEDNTVLPLSYRRKNDFIEEKNSINRLTVPFKDCFSCETKDKCCRAFHAHMENI
jgi:DNA-binding LytR/AlgR family response regulator